MQYTLVYFKRTDMMGCHYNWNEQSRNVDALFFREPSRRLFDRSDGQQVLFMVNFYGSQIAGFDVQHARIIEWEIAHHLPQTIRSEKSVLGWITEWMKEGQIVR